MKVFLIILVLICFYFVILLLCSGTKDKDNIDDDPFNPFFGKWVDIVDDENTKNEDKNKLD